MRIKTRIVYLVLINNTTFHEIAKSTVTCLFDFTQIRYLEGENDQFGVASVNTACVQMQSLPEGCSLWIECID